MINWQEKIPKEKQIVISPKVAKIAVYIILPLYIAGDVYRQIKGWNTRADLIILLLLVLVGLVVIAVANRKIRR
jgi:hypothetical protein